MTQRWRPVVRIGLRYASGIVATWGATGATAAGAIDHVLASPELMALATSVVVGVVNEIWYLHAKRVGGET